METVEEILQFISTKIVDTQYEIDAADAAGEVSELEFLEGLMEAYTLVEAAINYNPAKS